MLLRLFLYVHMMKTLHNGELLCVTTLCSVMPHCSSKSAMVGVFTPWKLASITDQDLIYAKAERTSSLVNIICMRVRSSLTVDHISDLVTVTKELVNWDTNSIYQIMVATPG